MRLSVILPDCRALVNASEQQDGNPTGSFLKWVANDPAFERLEVFLPPAVMVDSEALRDAAEFLQNPQRSFHTIHHLPEVWADSTPRILWSANLSSMARDRYIRDRFAVGPIAMSVSAHVAPNHHAITSLQAIVGADPVRYDSIQCASEALADAVRFTVEEFGMPPLRIDVVPPSVDCDRFRPPTPAERNEARRILGIPEHAQVAMCHFPIGPFGGGDLYPLVQAFAQCAGPDDWLVVGGDPTSDDSYARLKTWLVEAGVASRTKLLGCCLGGDVLGRLWAADFFVLPCDNANLPMAATALEAMVTGLPVIASDWAGLHDVVRDDDNGFLIPTCWVPGSSRISGFSPFSLENTEGLLLSQCVVVDQEIFAERLAKLLRDPQLRSKLGTGARATARAHEESIVRRQIVELFSSQLQEAASEPAAGAAHRRQNAAQLVLPTPYDSILSTQGTRALDSDDILELTQAGLEILRKQRKFSAYPEILNLTGEQAGREVLLLLSHGAKPMAAIQTKAAIEDVRYVIATLLKRGAIRLVTKDRLAR